MTGSAGRSAMTTGPLAGIRILEVGTMLAGPYATMMLADLGAEVIKIEPAGGEISRQVSDSYFASLNRGKRIHSFPTRRSSDLKSVV